MTYQYKKPPKRRNYAYIDGSFNPKTGVYGCGGFLVDQHGKEWIIKGHGKNPEMAKMRNVAGEILGAKKAINKAMRLKMDWLMIFYDYEGVAAWALGTWKPKKKHTIAYAEFFKKAIETGLVVLFQHVDAHTGIEGNERADKLAKEAVGL